MVGEQPCPIFIWIHVTGIMACVCVQANYVEDSLGVLEKYRFPFFTEMLW